MSPEQIIGLITGGTGAVGVLIVFITLIVNGKLYPESYVKLLRETIAKKDEAIASKDVEIKLERDRADAERKRADVAVDAAQTSNLLLAGIRREISP